MPTPLGRRPTVRQSRTGRPGSRPRNRLIAAALHDTDLAETRGTGIRTMRRLMEEAEKKPPEFVSERGENRFTAVIPLTDVLDPADRAWLTDLAAGAGQELTREDRLTLIHARDRGTVDNAAVRGMSNLDRNDASLLFRKLRGLGLLDMEGASSATYYVPTATFRASLPDGMTVTDPPGSAPQTGKTDDQTRESEGETRESPPQTREWAVDSSLTLDDLPGDLRAVAAALRGRPRAEELRAGIVRLCGWRPLTARQLADVLERRDADHLVRAHLTPLVDEKLLERVRPVANSRLQAYRAPAASTPDARGRAVVPGAIG